MHSRRTLLGRLLPSLLLFTFISVPALHPSAVPPVQAALHLTETTGTFLGYDDDAGVVSVNTRLGLRTLLVVPETLFVLNNRAVQPTALLPGDRVTIRYRFDTAVVYEVFATREARRSGVITAVRANQIDLRIGRGVTLTFTLDARTRVSLEGILLDDETVLVGKRATVVYEPGTNLLALSVAGQGLRTGARITALDTVAGTVSIGGRVPRTFVLDDTTTLRRNGEFAEITDLVVGDRVTIAFIRDGKTLRAQALQARP